MSQCSRILAPNLLKVPLNTQAALWMAVSHHWKKRAIWAPGNGWYSANPTAELTVVEDKKGVGEGRPITSPAQPWVVIGPHILADAIVWICSWKDNCFNHSSANISQRTDSRVFSDPAFVFSFYYIYLEPLNLTLWFLNINFLTDKTVNHSYLT